MPDAMVAPSGAPANRPGAPVAPATGYSPNPTMQQYQGQPQSPSSGASSSAPAAAAQPTTVTDPRDAAYYDQLARLTYAYNTSLAGYNRDFADASGAYNYTSGQLSAAEPVALQTDRNRANAQGLLESGQLAQAAGSTEAGYAAKRIAALSRMNATDSAATDRLTAALNAYNTGTAGAYSAAQARAARSDLATEPTTPTPPAGNAPSARKMAKAGATTAGTAAGKAVTATLRRMAAQGR